MNQFYDKILLALAVVVLAGGSAVYFTSKSPNAAVDSAAGDRPYEPVPVPQSEFPEVIWNDPVAQPSGFIYDVFTPFEIYLDKNGNFTQVGPNINVFANTFGNPYLVSIERPLYRIQMEGFIAEDPSDPEKILILMYDLENKRSVRARKGNDYQNSDFRVDDFRVERIQEDGAIYKIAYTTITDFRTGGQFVLNDAEKQYNDGFSAVIGSRDDISVRIELTEAGASFATSTGDYSLDSIDLDSSTVTITKTGDDFNEPITQVLEVEIPSMKEETEEISSDNNSGQNNKNVSFDAFF